MVALFLHGWLGCSRRSLSFSLWLTSFLSWHGFVRSHKSVLHTFKSRTHDLDEFNHGKFEKIDDVGDRGKEIQNETMRTHSTNQQRH